MMKIQSFGCQPLKPSYQLNSRPSFGNYDNEDLIEDDFSSIEDSRKEMEQLAKNKDSKFLSTIGTLGVGAAAGALSFFTFKTMAPKGWNMLKTIYNKIANIGFVKKSANFIKDNSIKLWSKITNAYKNINPETKMGKVKTFITDKLNWINTKTSPITNKIKTWYGSVKDFVTKNSDKIKEGAQNTGATLVAIPAAVTAVNSDLKSEGEEE